MTEEFLFYLWKYRLYDGKDLFTTTGEPLEVIRPGEHNTDSGPDFFNARIKIGETQWAGNIEIHMRSGDWQRHGHQHDKAYDSIILHVVYRDDEKLYDRHGQPVPTLELRDRVPRLVYDRYLRFKASNDWIPCRKQVSTVDKFILHSWLDRVLTERLERKSKAIEEGLLLDNNNWEEVFYRHIARSFGFKVNSDPFGMLAGSLPNKVLARHKGNIVQTEALLFGQAGLLEQHFSDKYPEKLQNEYRFLQRKFSLKPIGGHLWKFLRLRPGNFPTIRIAQFAGLVNRSSHLFSKAMEAEDVGQVRKLLDVRVSNYWHTHFSFDKPAPRKINRLGEDGIDTIIINTIVPFLFVYGKQRREEKYIERAFDLLSKTAPEKNGIIEKWKEAGVDSRNAYDSQALLQLKNEYCDKKRCLECGIGNDLMRKRK